MERNAPFRLLDLPAEIIAKVIQMVSAKPDLKHICEVSTRLYPIALRYLYEDLTINFPNNWTPKTAKFGPFSASSSSYLNAIGGLKYVKHLHATTKFLCLDEPYSCYHQLGREHSEDSEDDDTDDDVDMDANNDDSSNEDEDEDEQQVDNDLDEDTGEKLTFQEVCERLQENTLRSFSWSMRTCVIPRILSAGGCLPLRQKNIESLSLITDGNCARGAEFDLTRFDRIRHFSWTGPSTPRELEHVRDCLERNSPHLRSLTLKLLDWVVSDANWHHLRTQGIVHLPNFFSSDILGYGKRDSAISFPALQHLVLSQLSFESAVQDFFTSFNLGGLRKLNLWKCPFTLSFLGGIIESGFCLRLVSLEIVCILGFEDVGNDNDAVMALFLETFQGLEHLFLHLYFCEWAPVLKGIMHHRHSLKQLVLHSRWMNLDSDEESSIAGEEGDMHVYWPLELMNLLHVTDLEVLGMENSPNLMRDKLPLMEKPLGCKVLHIKVSGDELIRKSPRERKATDEDMLDFARWAFGPNGLRNLEILAHGDFSNDGRFEWYNTVFHRNHRSPNNFDRLPIGPNNEILADYKDALEACPFEALMAA